LLIVMNFMLPQVRMQATSVHFPGRELAKTVHSAWKSQGYQGEPPILGGPTQIVRNASWYSGAVIRPARYEDLDPARSSGMNDQTLASTGGLVLWEIADDGTTTAPDLIARFGNVTVLDPVTLAWQT